MWPSAPLRCCRRTSRPCRSGARKRSKSPRRRSWLAQQLQQRLEVKPARESNIINIAWTGRSPTEAARVANAFAQAYLEIGLELRTEPAKKYAGFFEEQVKTARDKLENAHSQAVRLPADSRAS